MEFLKIKDKNASLTKITDFAKMEQMFLDRDTDPYLNYAHAMRMYRDNIIYYFINCDKSVDVFDAEDDAFMRADNECFSGIVSLYALDNVNKTAWIDAYAKNGQIEECKDAVLCLMRTFFLEMGFEKL